MVFNEETIRDQNPRPCRAFDLAKEYIIVESFDGKSKVPVIPASRQVAWFNLYCLEHHLTGCIREAAEVQPLCYENGRPYMVTIKAEVVIDGQVVGTGIAGNVLVMGRSNGEAGMDLSDNTVFQSTATKAKSRALANAGFSLNYASPVDDGVTPIPENDSDVPFSTEKAESTAPVEPAAPTAAPVQEQAAEPVTQTATAPVEDMGRPPAKKRGRKPKAKPPVEEQPTSVEQPSTPAEQPSTPAEQPSTMTVEEAKAVICKIPALGFKDSKMGEILESQPASIKFWAEETFARASKYPQEVAAAKVLLPLAEELLNSMAAK